MISNTPFYWTDGFIHVSRFVLIDRTRHFAVLLLVAARFQCAMAFSAGIGISLSLQYVPVVSMARASRRGRASAFRGVNSTPRQNGRELNIKRRALRMAVEGIIFHASIQYITQQCQPEKHLIITSAAAEDNAETTRKLEDWRRSY